MPRKNPHVKLPAQWTPAHVRVNEQGKVQLKINPARLGSGGRFAKCVESVEARGGAVDPRAVCAAAGRKKYGKKKFQQMAAAGRKRAARGNPTSWGTSHFVSHSAAVRYYRDYEGSTAEARKAVDRKLREGEIHIGKPVLKPGQRLSMIDSGTRYAIHENPSRKKIEQRTQKALKKWIRKGANPATLRKWTVHIPRTSYDQGYTLSVKAKSKTVARKHAKAYCADRWAKVTGKPKSHYRLPQGTTVKEAA